MTLLLAFMVIAVDIWAAMFLLKYFLGSMSPDAFRKYTRIGMYLFATAAVTCVLAEKLSGVFFALMLAGAAGFMKAVKDRNI